MVLVNEINLVSDAESEYEMIMILRAANIRCEAITEEVMKKE